MTVMESRQAVEPAQHTVAAAMLRGARLFAQQAGAQAHESIELRIQTLDGFLVDLGQSLRLDPPGGKPVQQLAKRGATLVMVGDRRQWIHEVSLVAGSIIDGAG